jgi:V8-like Glu-specific endopeptidase
LKTKKATIMGLSLRRVLNTLLLVETFAALLPGAHGSHSRQVVETPGNQHSRIDQSYDTKENAAEGLTGPVLDSHLSKDVIPLQISTRIVGGMPTDPGEYPYFATTKSSAVCGASLIHPDILLTAAHCQDDFARIGVVYVGAHKLDTLAMTAEKRTIIRQYPHPDNRDLMLFQLNETVDTLPVVTLNSDPDLPRFNSTLTAIGFGATSTEYFADSDNLMAVDIYPVDPDTCVRQYNETVTVNPDTMLCAGHTSPNRDSCNGDSGGPLLDKATGKQVGIVSFGKGCGDPDFPGVYTRVSTYTSWIHDRICELSVVPPADCPAPNANSRIRELATVILFIKYDNRPAESFWRLEDDEMGRTVAFQPRLPERGASFSHVIVLPPGKYTLHFTDTAGDGICCGYGNGNIAISGDVGGTARAEAPTVGTTSRADNVLAHSDGKFGFHLSLPFIVVSGGEDTYYNAITNMYDTGEDSNLMAILMLVALSLTVILSTMITFVLRFRTKTRALSTSEKPLSKPSNSDYGVKEELQICS